MMSMFWTKISTHSYIFLKIKKSQLWYRVILVFFGEGYIFKTYYECVPKSSKNHSVFLYPCVFLGNLNHQVLQPWSPCWISWRAPWQKWPLTSQVPSWGTLSLGSLMSVGTLPVAAMGWRGRFFTALRSLQSRLVTNVTWKSNDARYYTTEWICFSVKKFLSGFPWDTLAQAVLILQLCSYGCPWTPVSYLYSPRGDYKSKRQCFWINCWCVGLACPVLVSVCMEAEGQRWDVYVSHSSRTWCSRIV